MTSSWSGTPAANAISPTRCAVGATDKQRIVSPRRVQVLAPQRLLQLIRPGGADADRGADAGGQLLQRGLDDEATTVDDQHLVDGLRDLGQDVARDQDGAPLGRERPQEVAQPAHPFGIEAVRGLVKYQQLGIAKQRPREPETLTHAK